MPTARARGLAIVAMLSLAILPGASQTPALRILSASPAGELTELFDAEQIRFVFSEPMVVPGNVPSGAAPPWIRFTPPMNGRFYWAGTDTLVLRPGFAAPLPYATRYTVRVDGSATSLAGRALGAPYELTFTTPAVRLLSAEWYRRNGRFDSPAVVALRFNQPVRPEDAAAHAHVALTPHAWTAHRLKAAARARWLRTDPAGLARFDAKVAAVRRVTSSADAVAVRVAGSWDEQRFPPAPSLVVLETSTPPPPEGWLTVTIDGAMPSPAGSETPRRALDGRQAGACVLRDRHELPGRVRCLRRSLDPLHPSCRAGRGATRVGGYRRHWRRQPSCGDSGPRRHQRDRRHGRARSALAGHRFRRSAAGHDLAPAVRREPHRPGRPDARLSMDRVPPVHVHVAVLDVDVRRNCLGSRGRAPGARARAQCRVAHAVDRTGHPGLE